MALSKTNLIILACIAVFALLWLPGTDSYYEYLAFSSDNLVQGRVWTLVTALFVHADIVHLAGNMLFLYAFGNALEKEVGAGKTMLGFFAGGILSFLLGIFAYPPGVYLVGASAAIFTLTAAVLLVKPLKFSFIFLMPLGLVALIYTIYNVIAIYTGVEGNVAYASHIIGFAVGIPFGAVWTKNLKRNSLIVLGLLIFYIFIAAFVVPYVLQTVGI